MAAIQKHGTNPRGTYRPNGRQCPPAWVFSGDGDILRRKMVRAVGPLRMKQGRVWRSAIGRRFCKWTTSLEVLLR